MFEERKVFRIEFVNANGRKTLEIINRHTIEQAREYAVSRCLATDAVIFRLSEVKRKEY